MTTTTTTIGMDAAHIHRSRHGRRSGLLVPLGLLVLALTACGGDEGAESVEAEASGAAEAGEELRTTEGRLYRVGLRPRTAPAPIGRLHEWVVRIERTDGSVFTPKNIAVDGGMPQHGHGFVTQPRVTREIAPGEFLVEGMKFHMGGDWVLRVEVVGARGADVAHFEIHIGP